MYFMSHREHEKFFGAGSLVRFTRAHGAEDFESTLIVKASTLLLKYILSGAKVELRAGLARDGLLAYTLGDEEDGGTTFSANAASSQPPLLTCIRKSMAPRCFDHS